MRNSFKSSIVGLVAVLVFALVALGQKAPQPAAGSAAVKAAVPAQAVKGPADLCAIPGSNTDACVTDELDLDPAGNGPAPARDFTGVWAGHTNAGPGAKDWPPMTALGQKMMSQNKPSNKVSLSKANDPFDKCDPLGFPRVLMQQTRGIMFAKMPDRILLLRQYDQVWREIFTDGRALPKGVGGDAADAPDPRWYGYSVGHWDDDHTLVVVSTGSDDRSWLGFDGHPHSVSMVTTEHWTRPDHNTLDDAIVMDDPLVYTKPIPAKNHFRWIPKQELEQQICVSSEAIEYYNLVADPAGDGSGK